MDWKTYYQERHLTADEAVKHIKSGNRVLVGHACGCLLYTSDAADD